jgi:hypothetical protein
MWLSFGWIPLVLVEVSIFFSSVMTAFVGLPLEIALMSYIDAWLVQWALSLQLLAGPPMRLSCRPLL